jgi:hypothetical protein
LRDEEAVNMKNVVYSNALYPANVETLLSLKGVWPLTEEENKLVTGTYDVSV